MHYKSVHFYRVILKRGLKGLTTFNPLYKSMVVKLFSQKLKAIGRGKNKELTKAEYIKGANS